MYMFLYKKSCWKITTVDLLLTFFLENQTLINTDCKQKQRRDKQDQARDCISMLLPRLFTTCAKLVSNTNPPLVSRRGSQGLFTRRSLGDLAWVGSRHFRGASAPGRVISDKNRRRLVCLTRVSCLPLDEMRPLIASLALGKLPCPS